VHGISRGAWEHQVKLPGAEADNDAAEDPGFVQVGSGSSIGVDPVRAIVAHYSHDDPLIRLRPRLQLQDLDDCMLMPIINESIAEKLQSIRVYANEYKLADIGPSDFMIDRSPLKGTVPDAFTADELADPWVRIRPAERSSAFHLRFTSTTPKRMYDYEETPDTPTPEPS